MVGEWEKYKAIGHMEVHSLITGDDKRGDDSFAQGCYNFVK